jgi:hypothetical protein
MLTERTPSFYQWRKRLDLGVHPMSRCEPARASAPDKAEHASNLFVPVHVTSSAMAEIEYPNGVRVRVPATNVEAIRAAVLASGDLLREESSC